jgi:hypothetical protein
MICDSVMNNDGVLQSINAIKYLPDQSVLKLKFGERIRLTEEELESLSQRSLQSWRAGLWAETEFEPWAWGPSS